MPSSYSLDLRKRVIEHLKNHTPKETSEVFSISLRTVFYWKNLYKKGSLEPQKNIERRHRKIDPEKLKLYIKNNPDSTLVKTAQHFKSATSSVYKRLKALNITYKKKRYFIEKQIQLSEKHLKKN